MGRLGYDQLLKESQAFLLCPPKDDLPYSTLDMRPSRSDDNPGQEGSIFGSCWTNFNVRMDILHHGFYFDTKFLWLLKADAIKPFIKEGFYLLI
jgi:hypothetical protein